MENEGNFPFQLPLFSKDNYEYWSIKMKTMLLSQELWELAEGGYTEPANLDSLNPLTQAQRNQLKQDMKG